VADMIDNLPPHPLVALLRDTSGSHINGLYDLRAADEIERLHELADSEGSRAVAYLRRARKAEAELDAARKDAARYRGALNIIAERTSSEDPCRALVECARRALRDAAMQAGAAP
jgi:hypothetical protein